jgi:hypothetical protein
MAGVPLTNVEDSYIAGMSCAICSRPDLYVQHLPSYPDFVTCRVCGAAFVVEDSGERVMYGKIPDGYPDTSEFALRQWVWLEAVERRAAAERPAQAIASPEAALRSSVADEREADFEPEEESQAPAEEAGPSPDWLAARLRAGGMPAGVPIPTEPIIYRPGSQGVPLTSDTGPTDESLPAWLRESPATAVSRAAEAPRPAPAAAPAFSIPAAVTVASVAAASGGAEGEPTPAQRHRVLIRGDRVRMPVNACAHCQKTPAPDRLPVDGTLPRPGGEAKRRNTIFQVPLCRDCSRRAKSRTTRQSGSRLMALLTGALVGLVLVVVVLATGIVPFATSLALGLVMLGAIWFIGFGLTAGILLSRAGRQAASPDANYVRTTLRVGADPSAPQTSFEWRNRNTALSFYKANGPAAVAEPSLVEEPAPA